jgi:tetratricopeptide (TPR) repeat protein
MVTSSDPMIDAQADAPRRDTMAPALRAGHGASNGGRARWRRRVLWAVTAGTITFNLWWYWRETRAVPRLATIAGWMAHQRYSEAEPALREHLRRYPDDGAARTMLARLLAARGDSRGCASELRRVPFWWPTKSEACYREGQTYLRIDRAREAEAAWLALVKHDLPHAPPSAIFQDACLDLLRLYAIEDRWEDAVPLIWNAYDQAASADRALWLIIRLRCELERVAQSETIVPLRRYVAADPEDGEALRALARAEQALGRWTEAARHFQLCLERHPNDARAWRDYLAMLRAQGDRDAFLAALGKAPAAAESEPQLWLYRGLDREWRGDLERAASLYRQAVARNPFVVEYHHRLALAEGRLRHGKAAAEHHQRAHQLREARGRLPELFMRYLDARHQRGGPAHESLATTLERLTLICKALGWTRAADACTEECTRAEKDWGGRRVDEPSKG